MREGPKYDWIIAVSNSANGSGIKMLKTYCKVSEVKQILVDLAKRDARKDARIDALCDNCHTEFNRALCFD